MNDLQTVTFESSTYDPAANWNGSKDKAVKINWKNQKVPVDIQHHSGYVKHLSHYLILTAFFTLSATRTASAILTRSGIINGITHQESAVPSPIAPAFFA